MHKVHTATRQAGITPCLQSFTDSFMPARAFPLISNGKAIAHAKMSVTYRDPEKSMLRARPHLSFWLSHFALFERTVAAELADYDMILVGKQTAGFLNSFCFQPGKFTPLEDSHYPVLPKERRPAFNLAANAPPLWLGSRGGKCENGKFEVSAYMFLPETGVQKNMVCGTLGMEVSIGFRTDSRPGDLDAFLQMAYSNVRSYPAGVLEALASDLNKAFAPILQQALAFFRLKKAESTTLPIINFQLALADKSEMLMFQGAPRGRIFQVRGRQ